MRPRRTPSSTTVFRLIGGTEDNDLWVRQDHSSDGSPVIASVWEFTDQERELIAQGWNLQLEVWGTGHPPVSMQVTDESIGAREAA